MTTTAPSANIDWPNLQFGYTEVNGYIKYTWKEGSWNSGEFVKGTHVPVHICSPALNYGQQCFEGLKAFRMKDGNVRMFRPQENAARLAHSADMVSIPQVPEEIFLEACRKCVAANLEFVPPSGTGQSMYLRPLLFSEGAQLGLSPPAEFIFIVFGTPVASYYKTGIKPVDAWIIDDFDRTAPLGTGSAKLGGNYAPVFKPTRIAKEAGYPITLHLDSRTHSMVDEFSTSNFIGIQLPGSRPTAPKKTTLIAPHSSSILKSVTTKSLVDIARKQFDWDVNVRPVPFEEVTSRSFDEIAAVGTAAIITPIRSISYRPELLQGAPETIAANGSAMAQEAAKVEAGPPSSKVAQHHIEKIIVGKDAAAEVAGDNFTKLYKQFRAIQDGEVADEFGWMWPKDGVKA